MVLMARNLEIQSDSGESNIPKPVIKLKNLIVGKQYKIHTAKLLQTKFGETVLLELEEKVVFPSQRVTDEYKPHIANFSPAKYVVILRGPKTKENLILLHLLKSLKPNKLYRSAKLFYIESIIQIEKRFVLEDVHNDSSFLNPQNANDLTPTSLYAIAKKYILSHITVDSTELDKEWRKQSLFSDMDSNDSSDTVDKRNRLDNETVGSILCVKSGLKRTGTTSVQLLKNQFEIPHLKFVQANDTVSESKKIRPSRNKV
ncbi:hypothetical protein JTB14_032457 [Gonioctena quinquepunctata]|nr:hypothetical protein JTB14_032457 [Gonioctena quinquepunctata]